MIRAIVDFALNKHFLVAAGGMISDRLNSET
jgi:hypothetical protein